MLHIYRGFLCVWFHPEGLQSIRLIRIVSQCLAIEAMNWGAMIDQLHLPCATLQQEWDWGEDESVMAGRFAAQPRLAENCPTPRSELRGEGKATAGEEALYQFFQGELNQFFNVVNDILLFVKLTNADGIELGSSL